MENEDIKIMYVRLDGSPIQVRYTCPFLYNVTIPTKEGIMHPNVCVHDGDCPFKKCDSKNAPNMCRMLIFPMNVKDCPDVRDILSQQAMKLPWN